MKNDILGKTNLDSMQQAFCLDSEKALRLLARAAKHYRVL